MLFLQYKSTIKSIHFPNTFTEFLEACKQAFPELSAFQIEFQSADSKVIIDSEDIYQSLKSAHENSTSLQTTVFVAMDLAELAKEECKVPETQSNSSRDKLEVPLLKGKAGPTPMGRTDAILDKLELYKAIYIDINYLELKEKIGKRVDKMKPENRKMLFDARDFGNLVIEKGKEYVNFLSDKIKTVTASA